MAKPEPEVVEAPFDLDSAKDRLLSLDEEASTLSRNLSNIQWEQGKLLLGIQKALGFGNFGPWLEKSIQWSRRKVTYLMNHALQCDAAQQRGEPIPEYHPGKLATVANPGPQRLDPFVEAATKVFGGTIDLKPTSKHLKKPWRGKVWLEPLFHQAGRFTEKLIDEYSQKRVKAAILSIDVRCLLASWSIPLWERPMCIAPFLIAEGGGAQGSAIYARVYFGSKEAQFYASFMRFGPILKGSDCGFDPTTMEVPWTDAGEINCLTCEQGRMLRKPRRKTSRR